MTLSMTGYGKSICEYGNKKIAVEIRSLNSKQLDLSIRIPGIYKEKEAEIRNEITRRVIRGKVEVSISFEQMAEARAAVINTEMVKTYMQQIQQVASDLQISLTEQSLVAALRLPDTLNTDVEEISELEFQTLTTCLNEAMDAFMRFRKQEGEALERDIIQRIELIARLLTEIEPFEKGRIERIRERLDKNLSEWVGKESIDSNRLEQEIIFYLEKLDVTEEKVRLTNHCKYFTETLREESAGKKLGFIVQEIGREINTIGSKANDYDIQKRVVMMKDELEKVKEQLMNVL